MNKVQEAAKVEPLELEAIDASGEAAWLDVAAQPEGVLMETLDGCVESRIRVDYERAERLAGWLSRAVAAHKAQGGAS